MKWLDVIAILLFISAAGCAQEEGKENPSVVASEVATVPVSPPPDVGDVNVFNSCKAFPRRTLTSKEACQIEHLRKTCSPADDCLVTCLNSPDALRVAGGCNHVCFSYLHKDSPLPKEFPECSK